MKLRQTNISKLSEQTFDVCIVGGGINGAVSAAALSARGVKTALIDAGDFAGMTSEQSSNLAWGGIKYMESFEFGLVRKLCLARNKLIEAYPSTVQPIPFYTVHSRNFRHGRIMLWLGAWLYWLIGNGFTKKPRLLSESRIAAEEPIVNLAGCDGGMEYIDAFFYDNDARFVWNFIRSALSYGCVAANYIAATSALRGSDGWHLQVRDSINDKTFAVRARVLINACGPLVDRFNEQVGVRTKHRHVLSKGIHLIVPRLTPNRRVLTFFADDGRLFFVIPMGPRTCIGTTDTRATSPNEGVTPEDRRFILDNINKRLRLAQPLSEADIIAERCGVRPLVVAAGGSGDRDWMQLSRKHEIEVGDGMLSIFGGKLTDCLNVGEEVSRRVEGLGVKIPFPAQRWYGEPPDAIRDEYFHQARLMNLDALTARASSEPLSTRLWRRYGAQAIGLLENIRADARNAEVLIENAEYIRCEIEQAARREMVSKLDDFLRRRSKIALVVSRDKLREAAGLREACQILFGEEAQQKLEEYFAGA